MIIQAKRSHEKQEVDRREFIDNYPELRAFRPATLEDIKPRAALYICLVLKNGGITTPLKITLAETPLQDDFGAGITFVRYFLEGQFCQVDKRAVVGEKIRRNIDGPYEFTIFLVKCV